MVSLDRVKACSNPTCRLLLPADCDDPLAAGFHVRTREAERVTRFASQCKECNRTTKREQMRVQRGSVERPPKRERKGGMRKGAKQHRVHEAIVDGVVRRVKFCPGCDRELIAEDGAKDSRFFVQARAGRKSIVFYARCKECRKREERERRERDPEYAKHIIAREKVARERWLEKPENQEKSRAACLAYYYRRAAHDREGINEYARMTYALRIEREEGRQVVHPWTVIDHTAPRLRARPFYEWLVAYQKVSTDSVDVLAAALDVVPRRIREVLERKGDGNVTVDVVDRALLNATMVVRVGGRDIFRLDDLYPV